MSQDDVRVSPDLIAQLNKLASRLTAQGEYEAVDLIDTVVARVTAMPQRELLADALDALVEAHDCIASWGGYASSYFQEKHDLEGDLTRARTAADKIRAAMGGE